VSDDAVRLPAPPFPLELERNDAGSWGASLLYDAELVLAVLDAARARTIVEVGALDGDLTRLLLAHARAASGSVIAIDPAPHAELEQLVAGADELSLIREPSLTALPAVGRADAIVLDGDHNHFTVSRELELIAGHGDDWPLVLLHDVCWPHARRDQYHQPDRIPDGDRLPYLAEAGLYPGDPGTCADGLPFRNCARREGGDGNGVLTAAEQFVRDHDGLRLAVVPAFFGLGVIWDRTGPLDGALAAVLDRWDRNPHLQRLERNRVLHLANTHVQLALHRQALRRLEAQEHELRRQRELLQRISRSRAFAAAELFLRLRHRRRPPFSRAAIDRLLGPEP
jgi:Methyltransferase domain